MIPESPPTRNYIALASLGCAVVAFFLVASASSEPAVVSRSVPILLTGLLGATLGYIGIRTAKTLRKGKGIAIAGLIVSLLFAVASISNALRFFGL